VVQALRDAQHETLVIDLADGARQIDVCDTAALIREFQQERPQYVFHLAAIADARDALQNPTKAVTINIGGTASVLEASRQTKVKRVILASTCWVANAMGPGVLDESSPFLTEGGGHVYTTTKIASELLAHDFEKLYGLPFTILRYGIPYGPAMWPGLVLGNFITRAFANQPLTIFGDGSASRRFVYVEDLARAHVLALQDVATNQIYNLEGMRFVAIRELAEIVSKMIGSVEIVYKEEPTRIGEFQYFRKLISNNKAYIDLGWAPDVELEEGVRRTIEWYKREMAGSKGASA
jgi:UDP-glucose 4-epimerase